MADEPNATPNAGATGDGGKGADGNAGDGRDKWTREDWERWAEKESDRKVSKTLKEKDEAFKSLLSDATRTAEEKLNAYEAQLQEERTRADFLAEAISHGITDPRAAYAVVKEYKFADNRGRINFDDLKKAHPALFAQSGSTRSVAGATGDTGGGKRNMTQLLREAARGI